MSVNDLYSLYTVELDGKTVRLKPSQLTTQVLCKIFGLFPESIILISEDGFVETPDPEGKFHDVDDLPKWNVCGDSLKARVEQAQEVAPFSYQPSSQVEPRKRGRPSKWSPKFTSALLGSVSGQKPPGVRAADKLSSEGPSNSASATSSSSQPEWRKYVEVCKWSEAEKYGGPGGHANVPMSMHQCDYVYAPM